MKRDLAIIGAGTAGLSAGIYAAASGYRVTVLEMAGTPGGLCTSWSRGGYLFDGSAAGLAGTGPGASLYRMWKELGVIGRCPLGDPESFGSVRLSDGRTVTVWTDIDRFEAHFLDNFPRDARAVRAFAGALRACLRFDMPLAGEPRGAGPSALSTLPVLLRYGTLTLRRFLEGLSDPLAVEAFGNLVHFGGTDVPLLTVLLPLAYAHRRMTGILRGGWIFFARAIEARLGELGGRVLYGARVERLKIESGKVWGVILADGRELPADRVLSAADGRFTRSLLPGGSSDGAEFDPRRMSDQPVQVNLGVAEDWSEYPGPLTWLLPDAPSAAGRTQHRLTVHHRCYDPASAPAGKSSLMAFLESDYGFWEALAGDRSRYEAEKRRCADLVVQAVGRFRSGFAGRVEVRDVSTPLTRERYTGNYMGTMQARKPDSGMFRTLLRGAPRYDEPGVRGFWRAGQWVEAWGGITTAARSGRNAIRAMCRRDGNPFAPGLRGEAA